MLGQPFSVAETNDYRAQKSFLDGLVEYHNMNFILLGRGEPERGGNPAWFPGIISIFLD